MKIETTKYVFEIRKEGSMWAVDARCHGDDRTLLNWSKARTKKALIEYIQWVTGEEVSR